MPKLFKFLQTFKCELKQFWSAIEIDFQSHPRLKINTEYSLLVYIVFRSQTKLKINLILKSIFNLDPNFLDKSRKFKCNCRTQPSHFSSKWAKTRPFTSLVQNTNFTNNIRILTYYTSLESSCFKEFETAVTFEVRHYLSELLK